MFPITVYMKKIKLYDLRDTGLLVSGYKPNSKDQVCIAYTDKGCTSPKAFWDYDQKQPRKGCKHVTLNCYRYEAVWV